MRRAVLVCLTLLGACAGVPPPVTPLDVSRAQTQYPSASIQLADLDAGRGLLLKKCAGCHATPLPSAHTPADWPHALDEMSARANLAPSQQVAIERYLVTLAGR